jgi:hypothetical protein
LRSFGKLNKNIMGAFSEQFKLSKRIRQADFGREKTREYWIAWANGVIDRATYKSGESEYVTEEAVDQFSEVSKQVVSRSDSFEDKIDNQI